MHKPKTKQVTVTTIQDMLEINRHNVSDVAYILSVNRATVQRIIDNKRAHVITVSENGELKLLK